MKKVAFTPNPAAATAHSSADAWVEDRHRPPDPGSIDYDRTAQCSRVKLFAGQQDDDTKAVIRDEPPTAVSETSDSPRATRLPYESATF